MPTFILYANTDKPNKEQSDFIHQQASEILAHEIGKSKDFVMTFLQFGADLKFGSSDEPCAYAEVKNVGE
ncbi:MAG: phenylpyruvate tautomerase MIF-related protein, partial [Verrucomicrobiota bacterium]|nr:phenylpyruvate tautomerase MIF-related protein [Verrucomicrobiota bacterium]